MMNVLENNIENKGKVLTKATSVKGRGYLRDVNLNRTFSILILDQF